LLGIQVNYQSLRRTQATLDNPAPDWESWLHFFLRCLQRQTVRIEERLAGTSAAPPALSPLAARLAALFETHATLTLSQAAPLLDASPHTLKRKFRELVQAGLITAHGKGRGAFYRRG